MNQNAFIYEETDVLKEKRLALLERAKMLDEKTRPLLEVMARGLDTAGGLLLHKGSGEITGGAFNRLRALGVVHDTHPEQERGRDKDYYYDSGKMLTSLLGTIMHVLEYKKEYVTGASPYEPKYNTVQRRWGETVKFKPETGRPDIPPSVRTYIADEGREAYTSVEGYLQLLHRLEQQFSGESVAFTSEGEKQKAINAARDVIKIFESDDCLKKLVEDTIAYSSEVTSERKKQQRIFDERLATSQGWNR